MVSSDVISCAKGCVLESCAGLGEVTVTNRELFEAAGLWAGFGEPHEPVEVENAPAYAPPNSHTVEYHFSSGFCRLDMLFEIFRSKSDSRMLSGSPLSPLAIR